MSSEYWDRISELANRAQRDRERFEPPADPPAEERAMEYLREGLGPTVALYVEARTGGRQVAFSAVEFSLLQRAMNTWLELYARCYGHDIEADFTVREAAELLIETHNIQDTAQMLTHVPDRHAKTMPGADDRGAESGRSPDTDVESSAGFDPDSHAGSES